MLQQVRPLVPRTIGVLGVAALLAFAGVAAAQTASVAVEPQTSDVSVQGGQSTQVSVDINLQLDQFTCGQAADFPVEVSASGAQGVAGSADPAELVFTVSEGIYDSRTPAGNYNETQNVAVTITAPSGQSSGFSADVTVTGLFPGGDYSDSGCGPSSFPEAEGSVPITVDVQPDASPTDGGSDGDGGTDGGTDGGIDGGTNDSDEENGSPVPVWLVPVGLAGAAAIASRRGD